MDIVLGIIAVFVVWAVFFGPRARDIFRRK